MLNIYGWLCRFLCYLRLLRIRKTRPVNAFTYMELEYTWIGLYMFQSVYLMCVCVCACWFQWVSGWTHAIILDSRLCLTFIVYFIVVKIFLGAQLELFSDNTFYVGLAWHSKFFFNFWRYFRTKNPDTIEFYSSIKYTLILKHHLLQFYLLESSWFESNLILTIDMSNNIYSVFYYLLNLCVKKYRKSYRFTIFLLCLCFC